MYNKCCVAHCDSKRQDNIKLHRFPTSEKGLNQWLKCMNSVRLYNTSPENLRKNTFVCHKHFERRFITKSSRLRIGSFPTLFSESEIKSGSPTVSGHNQVDTWAWAEHCNPKKTQHKDHTYSKPDETIIHRFPNPDKFPEQFESWVTLVGGKLEKPSDYDYFRKRVICDKHFTDADKNRNRRLNRVAVPTLHLPPGTSNTEKPIPELQTDELTQSQSSHSDLSYINEEKLSQELREENVDLGEAAPVDLGDAAPLTEADTFDEHSLPTTDHGETIEPEHAKEETIFSWQKSDLIETDDNAVSESVLETEELPEDATLSLFSEPIQEAPTELAVAVVPEDVEYRCRDCGVVIGGFSFWCLQCGSASLCAACAPRAAHDAHHLLRAPRGTTHSQARAVLASIRHRLLEDNLLTLNEIEADGVKVEVKEELERPWSPPAASPDPLAVEPHFETEESLFDALETHSKETHYETVEPQSETEESHLDALEPHFDAVEPQSEAEESHLDALEPQSETEESHFEAEDPQPETEDFHFGAEDPQLETEDSHFGAAEPQPETNELQFEDAEADFETVELQSEVEEPEFEGIANESADEETDHHHPLKRLRLTKHRPVKNNRVTSKDVDLQQKSHINIQPDILKGKPPRKVYSGRKESKPLSKLPCSTESQARINFSPPIDLHSPVTPINCIGPQFSKKFISNDSTALPLKIVPREIRLQILPKAMVKPNDRGVSKSPIKAKVAKRKARNTPVRLSEGSVRRLTEKAVVQMEPLTSLDIKKWTADTKRKKPT